VHHVGAFSELEDQLCAFASDFDRGRAGYSPDRLDALVWAVSELGVAAQLQSPVFGYYSSEGIVLLKPAGGLQKFEGPLANGGYATNR
jgi:hypothetical protein